MAMIQCPECNQPLSDQAYTCPHCGRPIKDFPQPEQFDVCLHQKKPSPCPGATFVRVLGILSIIGGLLWASYLLDWSVSLIVIVGCIITSIFLFILANVLEQVKATYEIITSMSIICKSCKPSIPSTPSSPASASVTQNDTQFTPWRCSECKLMNPPRADKCIRCGHLKEN